MMNLQGGGVFEIEFGMVGPDVNSFGGVLSSRQYDPAPSPNTTTGTSTGTPVLPYNGPNIGTFLEPFGKHDLLAYMNK